MGSCLARLSRAIPRRLAPRRSVRRWPLLAALVLSIGGCHTISPVDTKPLDDAGMAYDWISELKALDISTPEVAQVAAARDAGISDATCIAIFKIFHDRKQPFDAGDAAAGLFRAHASESTIVELAKLNELGLPSGEFQAMRLAGLSDATLLAVARHRAANEPVLSGASLASLKIAGVRESTLLELARRGVPDSKNGQISYLRRHGWSDAQILGHFSGS
jgi:hypothetical protein